MQTDKFSIYVLMALVTYNDKQSIESLKERTFESVEDVLLSTKSLPKPDIDGIYINDRCIPIAEFMDEINNGDFRDSDYWYVSVRVKDEVL